MQTELIIVSEYCHKCHMEGIDAIHHLLERMEEMKREMDSLRKQLTLYRKREIEDTDR